MIASNCAQEKNNTSFATSVRDEEKFRPRARIALDNCDQDPKHAYGSR